MTKLKPIPTKGRLICKFEWFSVYEFDGHHLWLEMDGGEGMAFTRAEFMGFFAKVWKRF